MPLEVTVEDENDNEPVMSEPTAYRLTVSRDTPVGWPVGAVRSSDADAGAFGEFTFKSVDDGDFNVDKHSGWLVCSSGRLLPR